MRPRTAYVCIPPLEDEYPFKSVCDGLRRLGIQPRNDINCDMLVTWTPWLGSHRYAAEDQFKRQGKPVIVVENGWLTPLHGVPYYQAALGGWNGAGAFDRWPDVERWDSWKQPIAKWRSPRAGHALVIGQRGHPTDRRTAPGCWSPAMVETDLPVLWRERTAPRSLLYDLANAGEVHVWTSNVASWALVCGVPVVQHGPQLMTGAMASRPGEPLKRELREMEFYRLTRAQWSRDELTTGLPFGVLLDMVERC